MTATTATVVASEHCHLCSMQAHQRVNPFTQTRSYGCCRFVSHSSRSIYRMFHMFFTLSSSTHCQPEHHHCDDVSSAVLAHPIATTSSLNWQWKREVNVGRAHLPSTDYANSTLYPFAMHCICCDGASARACATQLQLNDIFSAGGK